MEFDQEKNDQEMMEQSTQEKMKQWFQENLRVFISILIVVLIAGGIYSYSNRTESPMASQEDEAIEEAEFFEGEISDAENPEEIKSDSQKESTKKAESNKTSSTASSQETENSFIETAAKGDSKTSLARAALANFLEKNPDSALTAEHKIYIEDYLRKKINHSGSVKIGTSLEFSKDLIQEAISKAKNLNDNQLKNLHKYAVRVPSLS